MTPLEIALSQYGTKEIPGTSDNSVILQYAKDCGFTDYVHDEISWCSLFINWVMLQANKERSKALNARSWLNVGKQVDVPQMGDVVILWRGDPKGWEGHVGLFIRKVDGLVYLLAGNQHDQVNITGFPETQVLGYRTV